MARGLCQRCYDLARAHGARQIYVSATPSAYELDHSKGAIATAGLHWFDDLTIKGDNILLFGPPGVGKSHLSSAIGLALVDKLVAAMGGRIEVINRKPGAEFRITLPGNKVTSNE